MDFKKMSAIAAMMLLAACSDDSSSSAPDDSGKEGASIDVSKMTLREKVGQMYAPKRWTRAFTGTNTRNFQITSCRK